MECTRVEDGVEKHKAHQVVVRYIGGNDNSPEGNENLLIFNIGGSRKWYNYLKSVACL